MKLFKKVFLIDQKNRRISYTINFTKPTTLVKNASL